MRNFLRRILLGAPILIAGSLVTAAAVLAAEGGGSTPTPGDEKLIFGFEKAEMERIGGRFKLPGDNTSWSQSPRKAPEGTQVLWRPAAGYPYDLFLSGENRTEGALACPRGYKGWEAEALKNGEKFRKGNPGVFQRASGIFRTCGWHQGAFGSDWSTHPRLWMDIKSSEAPAVIGVEVEDNLSPDLVVRTFRVPKGEWTTLEFDLAGAEKARLLDRSKIASFYVRAANIEGGTTLYIDNIRLASADAKPALTLIKDESAWPILPEPPGGDGKTTRPGKPAPVTVKPDNSPIPEDEKPITIGGKGPAWNNSLHKVPRGIGAFDNKFLSSVFMAPTGGMRISADGGKTWAGSDGKPYTVIATGNNTPNRHGFFCDPTEILVMYLTHCAGGGSPSETYFRRVSFDGAAWTVGDVSIVDTDVRHCPEWYDVIRLPNGRLWGAWDHETRLARIQIRARFSDDNGKTWQHGGDHGYLGGPVALGNMPQLAAFGQDGAAMAFACQKKVRFSRFDQKAFDDLYAAYLQQKSKENLPWDRFTAGKSAWTALEILPKGQGVSSILGMPDGRVFVAVTGPDAVLVWDGKTWNESLADGSGILTRVGDDKVAIVYGNNKECKKILFRLMTGGVWSDPKTAVEEESGVKSLSVPRLSPPNFIPLAWSLNADANAIKTQRIPVK
ncbi:MAG: sialidase family protein [Planctomycetota bacterium]